jgi:hypothetical protein
MRNRGSTTAGWVAWRARVCTVGRNNEARRSHQGRAADHGDRSVRLHSTLPLKFVVAAAASPADAPHRVRGTAR